MAAGPWFTVTPTESDWADFGQVWASDGTTDAPATLQIKLTLESPSMENAHASL